MTNVSKKIKNKLIRSIIGLSLCLSLTVGATTAYAWFSNNKSVQANGTSVQINADNGIKVAKLLVYKYSLDEEKIYAIEDDPASPKYMELNEYDTVFTERQAYTPMIIKVPLENISSGKFSVEFNCEGSLYSKTNPTKILNNLSNIIRISCGISSTLDSLTEIGTDSNTEEQKEQIASTFYDTTASFFKNTANKTQSGNDLTNGHFIEQTFVQYSATSSGTTLNAKNNSVSLVIDPTGYTLIDGSKMNIYFYIDYDKNLVDKYVIDNLGAEMTAEILEDTDNGLIVFERDIKYIYFTSESGN